MTRDTVLFQSTQLVCLAAGAGICLIGALDRQGSFHLVRLTEDPLFLGLLLAPPVILAVLARLSRGHRIGPPACLLASTAVGICSIAVLWTDHLSRSREQPGREAMHFGALAALVILWSGCLVAAMMVAGERLLAGRLPGKGVRGA